MKVLHRVAAAIVVPGALALLSAPALAQGQSAAHRPEVSHPVAHDVSVPLRDVAPIPPVPGEHEKPLRLLNVDNRERPDGAVQSSTGPLVAATAGAGIEGVGLGNGYAVNAAPPDTNGSVGDTQYVQWVNEAFAVFDKSTGGQIYPKTGGAAGNTLFSGFSAGNCDKNNDGDPIVLWDKAAHRWVMTQFSVSTTPYYQCIAVSQTGDATGSWYRYAYSFGTGFNDYPKFGVWSDGYYASYNIFNNGQTFAGAKACAYDRNAMLVGGNAAQVCFSTGSSYGGLLPADVDGATAPPAGAAEYFVNFGTNSLNVWRLHADFANTANSTFTGPTSLAVPSFATACGGGTCIPQAGTSQQLDSLGDRLMYRFAYRRFADHESLLVNHSVKVGSGKRSSSTGVRWYELRTASAGGALTVYQQGTFAPDSASRWMGSMAMDKVGNIALGYSKSSSGMYPSIFYTGRVPTDPLGTMAAEAQLVLGGGSQQRTLSRWGDYSSFSVDPVDDCTLWYTTEYLASSGTFNWHTAINHIKFPGCQ